MRRGIQWLRIVLTLGFVLLIFATSQGQGFSENALLFSRTKPGGSARIQGLGGAQVSLGGDFSSALSNPAGLGMYNRSEATLSLGLNSTKINSSYFGGTTTGTQDKFYVPGLSVVFHKESGRDEGFLGGSFGITLTRINNFNTDFGHFGSNSESSITDYFIGKAYDRAPQNPDELLFGGDEFYNLGALAYNNYLIDFDDYGYGSVLDPRKDTVEIRTVDQRERVIRSGSQNQWSFAYGANFSDKLFIGATLGVTTLRYKLQQMFEESNFLYSTSADYKPVDSYTVDETIDISGNGVNLNLGLIYRPADFVQLGVSLITPTFYQLTDSYQAKVSSYWNNFDYYDDGTLILDGEIYEQFDTPVLSEYNLTTPLKFSTGATFISKFGFISGDVEFVNYGRTKYTSDVIEVDFSEDNGYIKSDYKSVINYRIGAEYRYEIYRLRVGYNVMADPYQIKDIDRTIKSFSAGAGIKLKKFSVDFAIINSKTNNIKVPYTAPGVPDPIAEQKIKNINVMLTFGITF